MPSKSPKQRRTMAAAAHNPAFAKKVGIPVSVAKEFNKADTKKSGRGASDKEPPDAIPRGASLRESSISRENITSSNSRQ
jgi:hypothetical protein